MQRHREHHPEHKEGTENPGSGYNPSTNPSSNSGCNSNSKSNSAPNSNIWISEEALLDMVSHLYACVPREGCGLLFGTKTAGKYGEYIVRRFEPCANRASEPLRRFVLDPAAWVRHALSPELLGIVHSHPSAPPYPSQEDIKQLQHFGALIPLYWIVSTSGDGRKPKKDSNIAAYAVQLESTGLYRLQLQQWLRVAQENV